MMLTKGILYGLLTVAPIFVLLQILIALELYRLRRRYFKESRLMAILQLVPHFCFPPGSIRSAVNFGRQQLQGFHPALVIFECTKQPIGDVQLSAYLRWLLYSTHFVRPNGELPETDKLLIQSWRRQEIGDMQRYLADHGSTVARFLKSGEPSVADPFCPLCLTTYENHFNLCSECEGVRLRTRRAF